MENATNSRLALLAEEERRFLEFVRPLGLDWVSSADHFLKLYGNSSRDLSLVLVNLPEDTELVGLPLIFSFVYQSEFADKPPIHLSANFDQYGETYRNYNALEEVLIARLGQGERRDTPNCISRVWTFGVFKVALLAWPPDRQAEWLTKQPDFHPSKFFRCLITLSSNIHNVYPSIDNDWVVLMSKNSHSMTDAHVAKIDLENFQVEAVYTPSDTFRNTPIFYQELKPKEVFIWKNVSKNLIGVSGQLFTNSLHRSEFDSLILLKILAGRGPAGREILIRRVGTNLLPGTQAKLVFVGNDVDSVDQLAQKLTQFWDMPLEQQISTSD